MEGQEAVLSPVTAFDKKAEFDLLTQIRFMESHLWLQLPYLSPEVRNRIGNDLIRLTSFVLEGGGEGSAV